MKIFLEYPYLVPLIAWVLSQTWKFIQKSIENRTLAWQWLVSASGMPSSHSAIMTSLTATVGILDSITSIPFTISLVVTLIIMHDASGLRQHAGRQAKTINSLIQALFQKKDENPFLKLKEAIGHKPIEVIIGGIFGIMIAYLLLIALQ